MFARLPTRRAIAASAVILFHLLLLFALVKVTSVRLGLPNLPEIPITLFFQPSTEKPVELPKHKPVFAVPPVVHSIYIPLLPQVPILPPPVTPQSDVNGLRALGRYLFNCSGAYYEQLSDREWAHCLANQWDIPKDKDKEQVPVLEAPKPSQFDIVITERKKTAVPIEHQCKLGQMSSNLGLPCYDFTGQ